MTFSRCFSAVAVLAFAACGPGNTKKVDNKPIAILSINVNAAGDPVGESQRQDCWESRDCVQIGTFNTKKFEHYLVSNHCSLVRRGVRA